MVDKVIVLSQATKFVKRLEKIDLEDPQFADIIEFAQALRRFYTHVHGEENLFTAEMNAVEQDAARFDDELKSPEEDGQRLSWKQKLYERMRGTVINFGKSVSKHGLPPDYVSPRKNMLISNTITFVATAAGLGLAWYFSNKVNNQSTMDRAVRKLKSWK